MKKRFFGAAMALLMLAALLPAQVVGAEDTETGGVAISEQSGESTPSSRGTISPPDATVIAALVYEDPQEVDVTDGMYSFDGFAEGHYSISAKKEGYVSYEQPDFYFMEGSELPSIELVKVGKINGGSGDVSVTDLACLFEYLSTGHYSGAITDWHYIQAVADVNGDGEQNILDYQQLYGMIKAAAAEKPEEEGQTTTTPFSGRLVKAGTFEAVDVPSDAQLAVTKRPSKQETTASGTVLRGYPDRFQITGFAPMYACDASVADYVLLNGSAVRAYLSTSTAFANGTTAIASTLIKGVDVDDATCGEYMEDVLLINGKCYAVGGTEAAMWNGKGILYTPVEAQPLPHKLANDDGTPCTGAKLTYDTSGNATAISCAACGKIFGLSRQLPASYFGQIAQVTVNGTTYFVLVSPGTSGGTTTRTTISPKTG